MSEWRPIETAPHDGTHILVVTDRGSSPPPPATVHWFDGGWHLSVNQRGEFSEYVWGPPTHWMPAPLLPRYSRDRLGRNVEGMWNMIIRLMAEGVLSEGQAARATGVHRIEIRRAEDEYLASRKLRNLEAK